MAWRIEFTRNADKVMRKLDKDVAARVFDELDEIAKLEDPRSRGKALTGNLAGVWRYRVGDYRILCDINDENDEHTVLDVADDLVVADPIAPEAGEVAHQRLGFHVSSSYGLFEAERIDERRPYTSRLCARCMRKPDAMVSMNTS
mgnify:CR=1 FL=1